MKITIISDIHANFDALQAFPEDYDELWVLGGLVNYGPQPTEVVDQIMKTAEIVVRGNHDHRPEPCIVPLYIYIGPSSTEGDL